MHCLTRGQRDSGRWRWFVAVLLCVDRFSLQQDSQQDAQPSQFKRTPQVVPEFIPRVYQSFPATPIRSSKAQLTFATRHNTDASLNLSCALILVYWRGKHLRTAVGPKSHGACVLLVLNSGLKFQA